MRREIHERAFRLALCVARLRRDASYARMVGDVVLRQMIRSATSIGANLEEATAPQSRADFPIPSDRRFNVSFVLAGVGTFSNFLGAFGGLMGAQ